MLCDLTVLQLVTTGQVVPVVIIHSTQLRAVRDRVVGAATVSLHQLRPLVAALIAGSRFKTMIYLIKPHFCIISRCFRCRICSPITSGSPRPLLPRHEIVIDYLRCTPTTPCAFFFFSFLFHFHSLILLSFFSNF